MQQVVFITVLPIPVPEMALRLDINRR